MKWVLDESRGIILMTVWCDAPTLITHEITWRRVNVNKLISCGLVTQYHMATEIWENLGSGKDFSGGMCIPLAKGWVMHCFHFMTPLSIYRSALFQNITYLYHVSQNSNARSVCMVPLLKSCQVNLSGFVCLQWLKSCLFYSCRKASSAFQNRWDFLHSKWNGS